MRPSATYASNCSRGRCRVSRSEPAQRHHRIIGSELVVAGGDRSGHRRDPGIGVRILRQRAEHLKGIRQAGAAHNPPIPPLSAWRTLVVGDYRLGDGCECHCKSGRFGVIASGRSRLWPSSARPRASAQQLPARSHRRRLYPEHRADRVLGHARRCSTGPIVVAWGGASCASRATTRPRSTMPVT